ncbi:MAG: 4-hydroxythreonine-4-phosphate dehydrogenase PdxA [Planctomycetaceae bacterium]|nr:4-hydroxythreonine-4-phosphate dehydrogenase PdxA [Planctomycetaceae bacterium]
MGDVAGIGPELIADLLCNPVTEDLCRAVVFGHPEILERALIRRGAVRSIAVTMKTSELAQIAEPIVCLKCGPEDASKVEPGIVDASAGQGAHDYLIAAIDATMAGHVDGIVTAPLNKAALHSAGIDYPGHTEILADRCGVSDYAMMLYLPPGSIVRGEYGLGVAHVTLHTSIRSVPDLITTEGVFEKIALMDDFLRRVGHPHPKIGVAALNPHAGEEGLFGDEERRLIAPAVQQQTAAGIDVAGPIPADALMRRAAAGDFDGVVAMYHDQGHIALKLLGYDHAVNITLGLPIVRTSPSHGTAYDIAWQGRADATGMRSALEMCCRLIPETSSSRQGSDTQND